MRIVRLGLVALAALWAAPPARADAIRVLCSQGLKTVVESLGPAYEADSGDRLTVAYDTSAQLKAQVDAGKPFDVVVLTPPLIAELVGRGIVAEGSAVTLARAGAAVAVRSGAPHPDISTDAAFKRAFTDASAVAYSTTGASNGVLMKALDKLGITDLVKAKGRTVPNGLTGAVVARGEAELAVQLTPELMSTPGVEVVGPFPADLQSYVQLTAGIAAPPADQAAAARFVAYLRTPGAQAVIRAKGLEP
jgi:molybdate transport system substrate-binding protein